MNSILHMNRVLVRSVLIAAGDSLFPWQAFLSVHYSGLLEGNIGSMNA